MIATITFVLMHSAPGDPFLEEQNMPSETLEQLRSHYGLNDPLSVQYIRYIQSVFTGNLGESLKYPGQSVNEIIINGFAISALIGLEALIIAIPLGVVLGIVSAYWSRTKNNMSMLFITVAGVSIPNYVIATALQFLFAIYFPMFPVARSETFLHTVLPSFALAIGPACFIARLLRASILEIQSQPYIHTARIKGLSEYQILFKHILKNATLPILGYLGPVSTNILVGSFIVERVYGIAGLGQWFVNGIMNRDYAVIGGLTLFYSILLIANHTLIDIAYTYLDPRVELHE